MNPYNTLWLLIYVCPFPTFCIKIRYNISARGKCSMHYILSRWLEWINTSLVFPMKITDFIVVIFVSNGTSSCLPHFINFIYIFSITTFCLCLGISELYCEFNMRQLSCCICLYFYHRFTFRLILNRYIMFGRDLCEKYQSRDEQFTEPISKYPSQYDISV
jgi:hypothetical protein